MNSTYDFLVTPLSERYQNTKKIGEVELNMVQEMVQKQAKPMRTTTVSPWYRRRVVGSISKKLVNELYSELL